MPKRSDFPKVIYVTKDDRGEECFLVWESPSASETDLDKVAIYRLDSVKTLNLTSTLT